MDTTIYLDYLAGRFRKAGVELHDHHWFHTLEEVSSNHDLVVNCTGIGAKALVPDTEVEPHRGQVGRDREARGFAHAIVCDDLAAHVCHPAPETIASSGHE